MNKCLSLSNHISMVCEIKKILTNVQMQGQVRKSWEIKKKNISVMFTYMTRTFLLVTGDQEYLPDLMVRFQALVHDASCF